MLWHVMLHHGTVNLTDLVKRKGGMYHAKSSGGLGTKILRWHAMLLHDTALEVNLTDSNLRKNEGTMQKSSGGLGT